MRMSKKFLKARAKLERQGVDCADWSRERMYKEMAIRGFTWSAGEWRKQRVEVSK